MVGQSAVLDLHALGAAGGAGGEDGVRGGARVVPALRAGVRRGVDRGVRAIDDEDLAVVGARHRPRVRCGGDQDGSLGLGEHGGGAGRRAGRVEREVGGAGLPGAEVGREQLWPAVEQDADDVLRADAARAQRVAELVGAAVERGEVQDGAEVADRDRVRLGLRLSLDQFEDGAGRALGLDGVPLDQFALALPGREQLDLVEPDAGVERGGLEYRDQAARETGHGRFGEQRGCVLEDAGERAVIAAAEVERQVGVRDLPGLAERVEVVDVGATRGKPLVVQVERNLVDRGAGQIPVALDLLDQPLEGQALVPEGLQAGAPDPPERLLEAELAGQPAAQREGVEEEADQVLVLRPHAPGDRGADGHVPGAAVPGE